jgi:hypothetical protein
VSVATAWGTTLTVEVSSAAPDADPVWVDISAYAASRNGVVDIQYGRQTELDADEPGHLSMTLRNDDHRFTSGNTSSPYYPWWKSQRRFRIRETVGATTVDLYDGYIELPPVTSDLDPAPGGPTMLDLELTAVDKLGRLKSSRKFISTLGEYILANGGTALKAYYPMTDTSLPMTEVFGRYPALNLDFDAVSVGFQKGNPIPVQPAAGTLAADDALVLRTTYNWDGTTLTGFRPLHASLRSAPITATVGQAITILCWINLDVFDVTAAGGTLASSMNPFQISWDETGGGVGGMRFEPINGWFVLCGSTSFNNTLSTTTGPAIALATPYPVAIRLWLSADPAHVPHILEWWIGPTRISDTSITGVGVDLSIRDLWAPLRAFQGLIGHVQLYVGALTDWDFNDYLAQYQMGLYGLERQSTGARVNTILDYAGVPTSLRDVDPGVAVMSRALLAGKTAGDALEEARRTELGRLFVSPAGRVQFHDRTRIYNV